MLWKLTMALGLAMWAPASLHAESPHPERLSPDGLIVIPTLTDTAISPDARMVVYVRAQADTQKDEYHSEIWEVPTAGGRPRRLGSGSAEEDTPKWSPDGHHLAYFSNRGGPRKVWLMDPDGNNPRALSSGEERPESFEWSPDSKRIAIVIPDSAEQSTDSRGGPGASKQAEVRVESQHFDRSHLSIIEVATGDTRGLVSGPFVISDFSWSPDGSQIVFTRRPTPRTVDDYNTDLYVVRVADGAVRPLVVRRGRDDTPKWSPDGTLIAFTSTNGEVGEYGSVDIDVVAADGGTPRDITPGIGERQYGFYGWSPDSRAVYFRVRSGVTAQLMAADARYEHAEPVTRGMAVHDGFSFSTRPPAMMAFLRTGSSSPKALFVSHVRGSQPRMLVTLDEALRGVKLGETSVVHWNGGDGQELEGVMTLPVGFDPKHRYPMLVVLHGGPSGAFTIGFAPQVAMIGVPMQLDAYPSQLFAARGYVLFMPNIRGSGGYGEAFRKANIRDWGGADLQDVLSGVDAILERGFVDPARLGIMGWSYGGFLTAWAISQTDRFAAASVGAGISDLRSWYGTTDQPDQAEAYLGGPPWVASLFYDSRSANRFVQRIRTPTLFQHGALDQAVPLAQAEQLHRSLVRLGIESQLVVYTSSGHGPSKPLENRDVWIRLLDWFDAHLDRKSQ